MFSLGIIADIQYCDCDPYKRRYYRFSLGKLSDCSQNFNERKLTFVIQLGDLIDRHFAGFDKVLPIYQKLHMPYYHVLGNHDFSVEKNEKEKVPDKLGLKKGYYDFVYNFWRFVVLDGNDLSLYAQPEDSMKYKEAAVMYQELKNNAASNAHSWNGGVGALQIQWLEKTIDNAQQAGEKVIIFGHFPVFPKNKHNLWNDTEVINIIERYNNVVAYINGHNHSGNYALRDGIHYLTLQAMVEAPGQTAYTIIEVYQDHLRLIGYGREQCRSLSFPLTDYPNLN